MNGRIVALDVGEKRIGVAVCDPSGIVVRAVGVVLAEPRERALAELRRIVNDEEAVLVLVGLPLTLRGEHGPQAQRVAAFADALRSLVTVPVEYRDERYTSVEAQRIIEARGTKRKKNRRRGEVDEVAASLILQDFLTEHRMQRPRVSDDGYDQRLDDE